MAQTAAHLVDHVIPPVPMRQWVISVPKRLRWFLGFRPEAVSALTHRFGSALNHHVHLHACVTDGVFMASVTDDTTDNNNPVQFIPARPITPGDLDALTERVRRRLIRWYKRRGFLDTEAAADLLSWNPSGFSIDGLASVSAGTREATQHAGRPVDRGALAGKMWGWRGYRASLAGRTRVAKSAKWPQSTAVMSWGPERMW